MIKKGQKIGQDIIDSVKDIDLISYLESCGESFRKEGDYYRHTTHDSLIIRGNKFSWNSRNEHGYGAIRFNQIFFGMSFRESVQALLEAKGTSSFSFTPVRQEKRKEPFRYPIEQESEQINEAREYLITERKIDSDIVDYCIRKGLIAQDDRKNVVFKWLNKKGKIIGAEKQGTGKSRYKYIFPNEVKHTGFSFLGVRAYAVAEPPLYMIVGFFCFNLDSNSTFIWSFATTATETNDAAIAIAIRCSKAHVTTGINGKAILGCIPLLFSTLLL